MRLLVKNLGRDMLRASSRRSWNPEHSCPGSHTAEFRQSPPGPRQGPPSHPHFILSVARGPEVSKVRSVTELCGLRMSVESYVALKGPFQCKHCQRFRHTQRN